MVFDDIIVGSGLAALATAWGLPEDHRVLVLTGGTGNSLSYYEDKSNIPCANLGMGGLGNFWHGVIPLPENVVPDDPNDRFCEVLRIFYPSERELPRESGPWLFVPYRPIRPRIAWQRLSASRKGRIQFAPVQAVSIARNADPWTVVTSEGHVDGRRLWLAAGALGTPALLDRSPVFEGVTKATASDHAILYLGQINRVQHPHILAPRVRRGAAGVWMQAHESSGSAGLVTTKPARFSYRTLDRGIQHRTAYGLPTTGVLRKVLRAGSLGLVAESIFNKFGLFPDSDILNVYCQVRIPGAYMRNPNSFVLAAANDTIVKRIAETRELLRLPELRPSQHPDLFVRGIHLHDTVKVDQLAALGGTMARRFAIVDASAIEDIGHGHHSFTMMTRAFSQARSAQQAL